MSKPNLKHGTLTDSYGSYTPSLPMPPVPSFPCMIDSACTAQNRICDQHRRVLFVKNVTTNAIFEIPYGNWENWLWYKERISDCTGIPTRDIRIIFAGCDRDGTNRHSGLAIQSTIHLIQIPDCI